MAGVMELMEGLLVHPHHTHDSPSSYDQTILQRICPRSQEHDSSREEDLKTVHEEAINVYWNLEAQLNIIDKQFRHRGCKSMMSIHHLTLTCNRK
jgi:hypothetical protein